MKYKYKPITKEQKERFEDYWREKQAQQEKYQSWSTEVDNNNEKGGENQMATFTQEEKDFLDDLMEEAEEEDNNEED